MERRGGTFRERAAELLGAAGMAGRLRDASYTPLEGGSDRLFTRISAGADSVILLAQEPGWEIDSYIDVGRFLRRNGVPVPEIFAFDRAAGLVLMEDLGDVHLDEALAGASEGAVERRYREAIDILVTMQTGASEAMAAEGLLAERIFDERELLGETDYFVREFVEGFCRISPPPQWDRDRRRLATVLAAEPRVFMHRDFQSRNLMVTGGRLRLIDFQTAHRGPGLYDAASLLRDAYHPLPAPLRRSLLEELHGRLAERGGRDGERFEEFYARFLFAGVQRNLQALAAFAKLGLRKGKRRFLDSIPPGFDLLADGVAECGELDGLAALVSTVRARLDDGLLKGL